MNKMNKSAFANEVCRLMREQLGEEYRVELQEVNKNNNVKLQGLLILAQESNVTPTIYLDSFYDAYSRGASVGSILEVILQIYREDTPKQQVKMDFFRDFEKVKDRICYKLINGRYNEELLEQIPHVPFLDLAICFYYAYQGEILGEGSILIYNSHMEMWRTSTAELMKLAKENTTRLFPGELCTMEEAIHGRMREQHTQKGVKSPEKEEERELLQEVPMKILTNAKQVQGAACILYPGLLAQIADKMSESFYILPSSVHEGATR
ncbi:MAG: DUF5688 family protein [Roseburia sp.]|nr:DUF5688 family protein [Roseburia sp.]